MLITRSISVAKDSQSVVEINYMCVCSVINYAKKWFVRSKVKQFLILIKLNTAIYQTLIAYEARKKAIVFC